MAYYTLYNDEIFKEVIDSRKYLILYHRNGIKKFGAWLDEDGLYTQSSVMSPSDMYFLKDVL